ncbi:hypothetical protein ACGVWS_12295, partial [Enterobacteriaceae bacterium LUAb1]
NSEVKRRSVDDSVGLPHVKVENCQALIKAGTPAERPGFFALWFVKAKALPDWRMMLIVVVFDDRFFNRAIHSCDQVVSSGGLNLSKSIHHTRCNADRKLCQQGIKTAGHHCRSGTTGNAGSGPALTVVNSCIKLIG